MNKTDKDANEINSDMSHKKSEIKNNINLNEDNVIDIIEEKYNNEEIKKIIEDKVDFYMNREYEELFNEYEEKINDLLEYQEKVFIKNEILKQKIYSLNNYLKLYCKKNNIDYDIISNQNKNK